MFTKRGQAAPAVEITVLVLLIALAMVGYIILLPAEDREALLEGEVSEEAETGISTGVEVLLSEAPGEVTSAKSTTQKKSLEPIRLYSTTESNTETLATSLTVSRNLLQNNYKVVTFDIANKESLESLGLVFFITESKGDLTITLNGNVVYEGEVTSNDIPIELPTTSLQDEGNTIELHTDSPGLAFWSSHYYLLQDIKLVEDYTVADTASTRTFSIDEPGDITSATLKYFITCNSDEDGILTIALNGREAFSDKIFCEYLNERELTLDADLLQTSNTLKFEITEGDYNIEEMEIELKTRSKDYPSFSFDIDSDFYQEIVSGEKEVFLKLSFGDETSEKTATVFVQEYSFDFSTEDGEYEKEISSYVDDGANRITLQPSTSFEIENLKVYVQ